MTSTLPFIKEMDKIVSRLNELRRMLLSDRLNDPQLRAELQAEYRELEKQKDNLQPYVKILWSEKDRLLLWVENGKIKRGLSGPIAERKFKLIKDVLQIEQLKS